MTWTTEIHVKNETKYLSSVILNGDQIVAHIAPQNALFWSWTSTDQSDALALQFYLPPEPQPFVPQPEVLDADGNPVFVPPPIREAAPIVIVMQSAINFTNGVYIDRGDLPEQTISLIGSVNSTNYSQTTNGGQTVVPASDVMQGGTVNMIYSDIV